jgi:hypothetical protein
MGAAVFDPSAERGAVRDPRLLLNSARVAGAPEPLAGGQTLGWNENTIAFDYSLTSLFREGETRFRTQLSGFDASPSEWTADGKSRYTNLPPGEYVFSVWGKDWSGRTAGPASLAFRIRPAPWRTLWAYALYAVGAVAAGYGLFLARIRTLQRRTRLLESHVRQRTAELDGKNAELAEHVRDLEEARRETDERNAQLARANRELLESNYRADRIFSALADALPGTVLDGKYRLEERIGTGGRRNSRWIAGSR